MKKFEPSFFVPGKTPSDPPRVALELLQYHMGRHRAQISSKISSFLSRDRDAGVVERTAEREYSLGGGGILRFPAGVTVVPVSTGMDMVRRSHIDRSLKKALLEVLSDSRVLGASVDGDPQEASDSVFRPDLFGIDHPVALEMLYLMSGVSRGRVNSYANAATRRLPASEWVRLDRPTVVRTATRGDVFFRRVHLVGVATATRISATFSGRVKQDAAREVTRQLRDLSNPVLPMVFPEDNIRPEPPKTSWERHTEEYGVPLIPEEAEREITWKERLDSLRSSFSSLSVREGLELGSLMVLDRILSEPKAEEPSDVLALRKELEQERADRAEATRQYDALKEKSRVWEDFYKAVGDQTGLYDMKTCAALLSHLLMSKGGQAVGHYSLMEVLRRDGHLLTGACRETLNHPSAEMVAGGLMMVRFHEHQVPHHPRTPVPMFTGKGLQWLLENYCPLPKRHILVDGSDRDEDRRDP